MQSYVAAGILALALGAAPALAQSSQSAPPAQTPEKPAQKPQEKPKKVWTDDNIGQLSGVNITTASATPAAETTEAAGEAAAKPAGGAAPAAAGKPKEVPPEKTAKFYKDKLDPLRKQLAETEAHIKEIQDALANPYNGTNKINTTQSAPPGPPSEPNSNPPRPENSIYGDQTIRPKDQLAYYENQRDKLQKQIEDLEAQAISNGLTRGEIQ